MANARFYAYEGLDQIKQVKPRQFSSNATFVLREPYLWQELLVIGAAQTVPPHNDTRTRLLRIEIPSGSAIRYEINPPNRSVVAGSISPKLEAGYRDFFFGPGWNISFVDAAQFP